jgi:hypothetical protein
MVWPSTSIVLILKSTPIVPAEDPEGTVPSFKQHPNKEGWSQQIIVKLV